MAATTVQIIQARCSGLYNDSNRSLYIELAQDLTDSWFFGDYYNHAVALRAAHMWTLDNRDSGGAAGSVTSKKEGDLSVGYSVGKASDEDLGQTSYGRQLLNLMKSAGTPGISVTGVSISTLQSGLQED